MSGAKCWQAVSRSLHRSVVHAIRSSQLIGVARWHLRLEPHLSSPLQYSPSLQSSSDVQERGMKTTTPGKVITMDGRLHSVTWAGVYCRPERPKCLDRPDKARQGAASLYSERGPWAKVRAPTLLALPSDSTRRHQCGDLLGRAGRICIDSQCRRITRRRPPQGGRGAGAPDPRAPASSCSTAAASRPTSRTRCTSS